MRITKDRPDDSKNLREQAEKIAKQPIVEFRMQQGEDTAELIHELRVHQIELEIQNEELRNAQLELADSRNKYCELYDFAPVGYFTLNKEGLIVGANLTGAAFLGEERDNLLKSKFSHFITPGSQDDFYLHHKKVVESGTRQSCEIKLRKKDGTEFPVQLVSVAVAEQKGEYDQFRTTMTDITERKRAEHKTLEYQKHLKRLAARLTQTEEQERRRIAGEIHDEISQTLAMVKIKLDTLRNSPPSEASSAEIEQISSSIEKVIEETRTLTFELSNPILYELGFEAAVAEWLSEQVQEKHGIAIEFQDNGKAKPLDDNVKVVLFRNVRELLTNCIKHASAGRVRVGIRRIDGSIEVVVEDNGVGFDPAQVRTATGKKVKFGLLSVRESLEDLGGSFEIESKPGAGCKTTMVAPMKNTQTNKEI